MVGKQEVFGSFLFTRFLELETQLERSLLTGKDLLGFGAHAALESFKPIRWALTSLLQSRRPVDDDGKGSRGFLFHQSINQKSFAVWGDVIRRTHADNGLDLKQWLCTLALKLIALATHGGCHQFSMRVNIENRLAVPSPSRPRTPRCRNLSFPARSWKATYINFVLTRLI
jgi:hypothetical protein